MSIEDKHWLNGPKLAAWCEEQAPQSVAYHRSCKGTSLARALHAWAAGRQPAVVVADHWLIELGLHLSMVPEDFYEDMRKRPGGRYPGYSKAFKRKALQRVANGESPKLVALDMGCSVDIIFHWRQIARKERAKVLA